MKDKARKILKAVIDLTKEQGCPPTLGQIEAASGIHASTLNRQLARLQISGHVVQKGSSTPYIPVKNEAGVALKLKLMEWREDG